MIANYLNYDSDRTTNVTVNRAPTDESVRLLKEFEQAARDKVVSSQELKNNLVEATVWHVHDAMNWKDKYKILIKINGKSSEIDVDVYPNKTKLETMEILYQKVSERIAAMLMNDIAKFAR